MSEKDKKMFLLGLAFLAGAFLLITLLKRNSTDTVTTQEVADNSNPFAGFTAPTYDLPSPAANVGSNFNIYGGSGGSFYIGGSSVQIPSSFLPPRDGNPSPIFQLGNGGDYNSIGGGDCCGCAGTTVPVIASEGSVVSISSQLATSQPWWGGMAPGGTLQ